MIYCISEALRYPIPWSHGFWNYKHMKCDNATEGAEATREITGTQLQFFTVCTTSQCFQCQWKWRYCHRKGDISLWHSFARGSEPCLIIIHCSRQSVSSLGINQITSCSRSQSMEKADRNWTRLAIAHIQLKDKHADTQDRVDIHRTCTD